MNIKCMGCMEDFGGQEGDLCPYCGYADRTSPDEPYHLSPRTLLHGRYIIGKSLGYGNFGVTYVGWDTWSDEKVAIKEYLPSDFSSRLPGDITVTIYPGEKHEQFSLGLKRFIREAAQLEACSEIEGVPAVIETFRDNDTGYIATEFLDGETLESKLKRVGKLDERETKRIAMSVLNTLKTIHERGIVHRNICPKNLFLTSNGKVKLLDFGAARYATTGYTKSLTLMVNPGYTPEEQCRSRGKQGSWSDMYALAATLYKCVTGKTPEDSMDRMVEDKLKAPSKVGANISKSFENTILSGLNVNMDDRIQNADEFLEMLESSSAERKKSTLRKIGIKSMPLWQKIAIPAACVALLVGGVVFALNSGALLKNTIAADENMLSDGYVNTPGTCNRMIDEAEKVLKKKGLVIQIVDKQTSNVVARDMVMSQSPAAGDVVQVGSVINVVISAGEKTEFVPSVTDFLTENAIETLEGMGFLVETKEEFSDLTPKGYVISQSIEADTEYAIGKTIVLTVSSGHENVVNIGKVTVPDVVNKEYSEAKSIMVESGLYLVKLREEYSSSVEKGRIISQSVKAGKTASGNDIIEVVVSMGIEKVRVPDVQFKTQQDAIELLTGSKLTYQIEIEESKTVAKGNVIKQSIEYNKEVPVGTNVVIYVSKGVAVMPKDVKLSHSEITIQIGEKTTLSAVVSPANAEDTSVSWSSSDSCVSVDANGNITAKNIGTAYVTATTVNGKTAKCKVSVVPVEVTKVNISSGSERLTIGDTVKLTASVYPDNASDKNISWSSSDTSVATVSSSGSVTAVSVGKARITAKASNGVYAECVVTVEKIMPEDITISSSSEYLDIGETIDLYARIYPEDAYDTSVIWSSSDTSVARVSSGRVTAVSAGTAHIEVSTVNGLTDSCTITVAEPMVYVPDLTGYSEDSAKSELKSEGFKVALDYQYSDTVSSGYVIYQSPAGEMLEKGGTVNLTISRGGEYWTETDYLPSAISSSKYYIEYSYRDKETTTSSSSSKSGWTQYDYDEEWGSWSDWSETRVSESATREVETKKTEATYTTEYSYKAWFYRPAGASTDWTCYDEVIGYEGQGYWQTKTTSTPLPYDGTYGNNIDGYYEGYRDSRGIVWYHQTENKVIDTPGTTLYRYRDGTFTYYYYRWGSWSSWSTTSYSPDSDREVRYRYKLK